MIEIDHVSKSFGEIKALDSLTLRVPGKTIFGFIGPDGSGKTTLFRLITSLMLPGSGAIKVNGYDTVKDYKQIRKFTGYMAGRFSLYQDLTVLENLKFYASIFGTTIEENYDNIRNVYSQIEPFKNRLAGKLSGGMKQKLALSCALIHKPGILVLDEPTTGVDAVSRKEFWELLRELKAKGITIVVSTPYMDEAELCDDVALMYKGRILEKATPAEIVNRFDKPLMAISSRNSFRLVKDLRDYDKDCQVYLFGQSVHYSTMNPVDKLKLESYLIKLGHEEVRMDEIEASVEDIFIAAISEAEHLI